MNEDQRRQRIAEFECRGMKWVPCETCGDPTHICTKRCDGCWEVEHRLRDYLKTTQGQAVVAKALVQAGSDSVVATRLVLVNAVEKWANADCGATEAEEVLGCLAKLNDLGGKAMNSKAMEQVIETFDDVTRPEHMSKEEYVEFTEELISDLQVRLEAAREELKET